MHLRTFVAVLISIQATYVRCESTSLSPFQATGFKIGEVSDTSAIIWTRLTKRRMANPATSPMYDVHYEEFAQTPDYPSNHPNPSRWKVKKAWSTYPDGVTQEDIRFAAPGLGGEVQVLYRRKAEKEWQQTKWLPVETEKDFTRQFHLRQLKPNQEYTIAIKSRNDAGPGATLKGAFRTAPSSDQSDPVLFTVSTGQAFRNRDDDTGYKIYNSMAKLQPSFFVHTGDIVYYDLLTTNIAQARYHWQRTYSLPTNVKFHRFFGSYFIKDDHDTWTNDCWRTLPSKFQGTFTFEQGLGVFREQVPMGDKTYRTARWGKHLQVWLVEGRNFRSPNTDPDGPNKTILGEEQKKWLLQSVKASDATFRILISATPIVGPDRSHNKHDNHSNLDWQHEGDELRSFVAAQKNMFIVCGDRHWQYHSQHPKLGIHEFSCGPASDKHAGGWSKRDFRDDYHKFLKVAGGFLAVESKLQDKAPTLTFRFHDCDGNIRYSSSHSAK